MYNTKCPACGQTLPMDGRLIFDNNNFSILYNGRDLNLIKSEYLLLQKLAKTKEGSTRRSLANLLENEDPAKLKEIKDININCHMKRIREKIADTPLNINTIYGVGYHISSSTPPQFIPIVEEKTVERIRKDKFIGENCPVCKQDSTQDIEIDDRIHSVKSNGQMIHPTPFEYKIFSKLLKNRYRIVRREEILNEYDTNFERDLRTIDTRVKHLRKKISEINLRIGTYYGIGYKIEFQIPEIEERKLEIA